MRRTIATVAAVVSLLAPPSASAQSVEEFYKSRTVTMMVGFNVGNIYDTVMRTVARHIGKHIPGNPTVVPVNRPGAGSLAAANQLFNASPRDGTVIGVFNRSIPTEPLLGSNSSAKFDATKFTWIGNVGNEVSVCVTSKQSAAKTWDDLIGKPMQFAVTSVSADTGVYPLLLNNMFGAKLKLVTGYQGGADMTIALERGWLAPDGTDPGQQSPGARPVARLSVSDTGIGIPSGEQGKLFTRFFRASTAQRSAVAGVGLGLSITKAITTAHGGTLDLVSAEGRGTTFTLTLPA